MRVALVSPYDLTVPGGVQGHVIALANALAAGGDAVLVTGPGAGTATTTIGPSVELQLLGRSRSVPFNGARAPIALSAAAGIRLRRALDAFAPEVVHVHEPFVPFVGLAATRGDSAPVVATFHAYADTDRLYRLVRPCTRRVVRRLADLIAVSGPAATYHAGALGISAQRFAIVPNGVDTARFAAVTGQGAASVTGASGTGANGPVKLLFVGRIEPRKGLRVLLDALGRLPRSTSVQLIVAGDGPDRKRCQEMVVPELKDRVTFLGRVDDDELVALYLDADIVVAPALGGESFGIVLLEALAAGAAVVASDLSGFRAVLGDGRYGLLVPSGDGHRLATAIAALVDDPQWRREFGRLGRQRAAEHDWQRLAARIRTRYRTVIADRADGRCP